MSRFKIKIALLLLAFVGVGQIQAATVTIEMRNNFFSPKTVTISVGDTVIWVQRGQNHDTVSEDGLWSSGILSSGKTFPFTFDTPGTYDYFCTPHQSAGMTGTITVKAAANQPPTVTLTSPANSAKFSTTDSISFAAAAADAGGSVASVEFFAGANSLGTSAAPPYSVVKALAAGAYAITARATDNLGLIATSAVVNITVEAPVQNLPPTISLSAAPTLLGVGDTLVLKAEAADPDGTLAKVEFFKGTSSVGVVNAAPFELSVPGLSAGVYSFTAAATDNSGSKTTSAVVEIRVAAQPKIDSIVRDASGTTLTVTGTTGILHTLEGSGDLGAWSTVGTITPTNGVVTVSDPAPGQKRFYRMLVK